MRLWISTISAIDELLMVRTDGYEFWRCYRSVAAFYCLTVYFVERVLHRISASPWNIFFNLSIDSIILVITGYSSMEYSYVSLSLSPLNFYYSPLLLQPFENSSCARLVITVKTHPPSECFPSYNSSPIYSFPRKCFPKRATQSRVNYSRKRRRKEKKKLRRGSPSFLYVAQRWQFRWNNVGLSGH